MRVETRQKIESEKTQVYAQNPRLKMPLKNSKSGRKVVFIVQEHSGMAAEGGSAELPAGGLRPHGGGGRAHLQPPAGRPAAGQRVQGHHH